MPFSLLRDEQILELLTEQKRLLGVPGVALALIEFLGSNSTEIAVVVTVYERDQLELPRLPLTVAGLPVIVKVEEKRTRRVVETIDPRKNGGSWPGTNCDL